jgi:DNA replication protein DnaD
MKPLDRLDEHLPEHGRGSSKWLGAADAGFMIVPDVLLAKQSELGLGATEFVVLLQVLSFWWASERPAFPPSNIIARRMKVEQRTVQRGISRLEALGLIKRERRSGQDGKAIRVLTFDGLVKRLQESVDADPVLNRRAKTRRAARQSDTHNELSA